MALRCYRHRVHQILQRFTNKMQFRHETPSDSRNHRVGFCLSMPQIAKSSRGQSIFQPLSPSTIVTTRRKVKSKFPTRNRWCGPALHIPFLCLICTVLCQSMAQILHTHRAVIAVINTLHLVHERILLPNSQPQEVKQLIQDVAMLIAPHGS